MLDRILHLVGLQRADQVQREVRKIAAQLRIFRLRLLHPVLAEDAMPGGERRAHALRRMGLADGDQRHALGRPAGGPRRRLDASADGREIGADRHDDLFHSAAIPGKGVPKVAAGWPRRPGLCDVRSLLPPSAALAASLSLVLAGLLAGCGSAPPAAPPPAAASARLPQQAASEPEDIDTESTILTVLGLAKKPVAASHGPQTGDQVSPILWQAAHDTLDFVKIHLGRPADRVIVNRLVLAAGKTERALPGQRLHPVARAAVGFVHGDGRAPAARANRAMDRRPDRPRCRSLNWKAPSCCGRGISAPSVTAIPHERRQRSRSDAGSRPHRPRRRRIAIQFPRKRSEMAARLARARLL